MAAGRVVSSSPLLAIARHGTPLSDADSSYAVAVAAGSAAAGASKAAFVVGALLLIAGQYSFTVSSSSALGLALWLAGLGALVLPLVSDDDRTPTSTGTGERATTDRSEVPGAAQAVRYAPRTGWSSRRTVLPAGLALAGAATVWLVQRARPLDQARWDVVALWLGTVVLAGSALWQPPRHSLRDVVRRLAAWCSERRVDLAVVAALTLLGTVPLLVALDSYPSTFNGDEAGFALLSRQVLEGDVETPFGVGYVSHPLMWNHVQAASMALVGDGVPGARLPSALAGGVAVGLTYVIVLGLVRRRATAVAAAVLLATFHVHLYWSRTAFPNALTAMWTLVVVALLQRGALSRRPAAMFAVGVAMGLGQYFYFANRVLPLVVIGVVLSGAVWERRHLAAPAHVVRVAAQRLAVAAVGLTVAVLPQAAYYARRPGDFDGQVRVVSAFSNGWLSGESERTGAHPVEILARHVIEAALIPFRTVVTGQFRGEAPYVGWPLAILVAIGLLLATLRMFRGPGWSALALTYWTMTFGIAATVAPSTGSRWSSLAALVGVFAALGLDLVVTTVAAHWPVLRRPAIAVAVVAVAVTGVLNAHRFFRDPNQVDVYGDANTEIVDGVARTLADSEPLPDVFLAGAPRVWFDGFRNYEFRAPGVVGVDLAPVLGPDDPPPAVEGPSLFVVIPERLDELAVIERWFPDGTTTVVRDDAGEVRYATYAVTAE